MQKWHDLAASYAKGWDTRRKTLAANCITLDEVALEAARQLFRSVPFTIEDQIPVFTAGVNGSKNTTAQRKKNSLKKL
jgi:hypothetical protein